MKADKRYEALVDTGRMLFWKYGIRRVTIEEICKEAGVSKMTYYKHFPNKNALVKVILDRWIQKLTDDYDKVMEADETFEEKMAKIILMKIGYAHDISQELVADLYGHPDKELAEYMNEKIEVSIRSFENALRDAQIKGEIRREIKIEFIVYMINKMKEMASDRRMIDLYGTTEEWVAEMTGFFTYGILPRQKAANDK